MPIITSDKYIKCLFSVEWLENVSRVGVVPSLSHTLSLALAPQQLVYRSLSCTNHVRRVNRGRKKKHFTICQSALTEKACTCSMFGEE